MLGAVIVLATILIALAAPLIATDDPDAQLAKRLLSPSRDHLLGTDELGRDTYSRIVYGSRVSLQVGVIAVAIALVVGTGLGVAAGFVGGRFDVQFDRRTNLGRLVSTMMNIRSRMSGIATGDQAIFVRRDVFERMRGYSPIPLMEDLDFTRRLKKEGRVAALRDKVTTSYRRWEQRGPVRTILLMWTIRFLYWLGVNPGALSRLYAAVR